VQLLQPSVSATLSIIDLRNKRKKALEKTRLQSDEEGKKRCKREASNPFAILFQEETDFVVPDPLLGFDVIYGSPLEKIQIVAKSPEDALAKASLLTQVPSSYIYIYHASSESFGTYKSVRYLSAQHTNWIVPSTSIFSPLLFFSDEFGGSLKS